MENVSIGLWQSEDEKRYLIPLLASLAQLIQVT